jgi:hypothetical protein
MLTPKTNGSWSDSVLQKFTAGRDGGQPFGGVIQDGFGKFVWNNVPRRGNGGYGVVHEITP